jgi:hypothetical protein
MLGFRYKTGAEMQRRTPKDAARLLRMDSPHDSQGARPILRMRRGHSAGWLADTFSMDLIVLIRHPAAFVNNVVSRRPRIR